MKNLIFILFIFLWGCTDPQNEYESTEGPPVVVNKLETQKQETEPTARYKNADSVTNPILPQTIPQNDTSTVQLTEKSSPKESLPHTPVSPVKKKTKITARVRMQQLIQNKSYQKENGSIKRMKVAKQLNNEGFRKTNGKKFTLFDIPKN